jgi:2-polyprenyl-3-methyl-5-hydroxy-6-metoxy-1,4-benzoquinol methylase
MKLLTSAKKLLRLFVVGILRVLPPKATLRLLFRLDRWLYYLEGQIAIAYGDGVHPKHRLTNYHDFFVERVLPKERVLDIGCGIGAVAHAVATKSGAQVVGIDLNPDHIAQAREHYAHPGIEYHIGDAQKDLPEGHFDVIILSNILEHLPDRSAFLQQLWRRFSPARLLIRVPLFEREWRVPLKRELGVEWWLDPTHETEYTLKSFAEEIEAAGLRIISQQVRWGEIWAETVPCQASEFDSKNSQEEHHT